MNQARRGCPDVDGQDRHSAGVADEPEDHRAVDDGPELLLLQNVEKEAREEGARPEGDDRQVEIDPEPEGETVVHVGLIETARQAEVACIETQTQEPGPRHEPEQETPEGSAVTASWHQSFIHG